MKVEMNGAYRIYAQNSTATPPSGERRKKEEPAVQGQQDRVSISQTGYQSELERLSSSAAAEVEGKVSAAQLGELRQSVAAGQYHVPTEKLTEALLSAYV